MDWHLIASWVRIAAALGLLGGGCVLMLAGAVGLLRFPDFYARLHGAFAALGPGAGMMVLGLALTAEDGGAAAKLVVLALLIVGVAPLCLHLLGASGHAGGLTPMTGAYVAPRPGRQRTEAR